MAQPVALPEPSGMYEKGRPSPAAAQAALAAAKEDNVGPPFFNKSFLLKVSETLSSSVGKRFLAEVFEKYDQDHNGLLNFAEVTATAEAVYKVLGLPLPPKRVISDLRDAAASAEAEAGGSGSFSCLGNQGFAVFFMQLMKKAKMKLKAENFTAKQQGGPRRGARPEVPQECPQLPEGLVVEVYAYRWCYPDYEEGAKKLRLRKFHAERDRLPPRDGLVVIGSYRHVRGECREGGPSLGAYVIGVRDEASGEDFVLDGRGLRPSEPDEDEPESHLRARREAAEVGKCCTVRDRLVDMRALLAARIAEALPPAPKAAAKAAARPSRAQLPAAAFAAFGPGGGRASVKPATTAPPPPPPPAGGARRGSSPSSSPSGRRTRRDSADPPNLGRKEEWLSEPQWIQTAAASAAEEEGCLDLAKGQWLCVQFIGSGGDAGWCYGANEAGTAGWFPADVLGGWSPGPAVLGNIPEGFGVETS